MDKTQLEYYINSLQNTSIGKYVGGSFYVHKDVVLENTFSNTILEIGENLQGTWNVIKITPIELKITFLTYLDFETAAHPILRSASTLHLKDMRSRTITYNINENPPILHRKELLVRPDHPNRNKWAEKTKWEESQGLYENTKTIGFLQNWNNLLKSKGLVEEEPIKELFEEIEVHRHKTAMARTSLSRPVQSLIQEGILVTEKTFFDYGCGRGDDIAILSQQGFEASGWDPIHYPHSAILPAQIINLGFVLNVIEDAAERVEVLHKAFNLASEVLSVAVLVENMQTASQLRPYKDGFLTSKNTFQKYFNQTEIAGLLEEALDAPVITTGPGLFFVFKKPELAEDFYLRKSLRSPLLSQVGFSKVWTKEQRTDFKREIFFKENVELIESYWQTTLNLGRFPLEDEFLEIKSIKESMINIKTLQQWVLGKFGTSEFEKALETKRKDVLVTLAMRHFQKRLPLKQLPARLQNDIKACFPNFNVAWDQANRLLYQIGKPATITEKCNSANVGRLDEQALYVKPNDVASLDPLLRVYTLVGGLFYGNIDEAHEIKIHKASGKITFLQYENPLSLPPKTAIRVKVDLGRQKVEYYDHRKTSLYS